jgi:hypothetical protein
MEGNDVGGLMFVIVVGSAIWMGVDGSNLGIRRGRLGGGGLDMSVGAWVVCGLLLWIVAFPCYLVARGRYQALARSEAGQPSQVGWAAAPVPNWPAGFGHTAAAAATMVAPAAAPQYSPDGRWWWNGQQWLPVS